MTPTETKSPADIAVQIICIVEKYILEDRLTAHKAAPLVMDMIVAAQKQTRKEALEEAMHICLDVRESLSPKPLIANMCANKIRALIEKENEK